MKRQEQVLLLVTVAALVVGGVIQVKFSSSGLTQDGGSYADTTKQVVNSTLRGGLAYATGYPSNAGDWQSPRWSMASPDKTLRLNHPLFRRPRYIGENRHKVMCEGWGGWYYNPPSEAYF